MTVLSPPSAAPAPPVGGDYTDALLQKVVEADLAAALGPVTRKREQVIKDYLAELTARGIRLVDMTSRASGVDEVVYARSCFESAHWRKAHFGLVEWVRVVLGIADGAEEMQPGDLGQ